MLNLNSLTILDGAMGTTLMNYGFSLGECIESFNYKKAELIKNIHLKYLEAGSDIITTNTFGANSVNLEKHGYNVEETIFKGVNLAKKAIEDYKRNSNCSSEKLVALDLGPTGKLPPYGNMNFMEVYNLFKEQVQYGVRAGADIILIETMLSIEEARAAVLATKEHSKLPVFCTFTFNKEGKTMMGEGIEEIINTLEPLNIDAIGANCSMGIQGINFIAEEFLKYSELPIIMKPNAGLPRRINNKNVYDITPLEFTIHIKELIKRGITIVGGCCGTTPEFIREISSIKIK